METFQSVGRWEVQQHTAAALPFGSISQSLTLFISLPLSLSKDPEPRISLCQISPSQKRSVMNPPKLRYYYLSLIDHLSTVLSKFIPWRNEPTKDSHSHMQHNLFIEHLKKISQ